MVIEMKKAKLKNKIETKEIEMESEYSVRNLIKILIIIVLCFVYDNEGNKIFLGKWGYNLLTNEVMLLSKTESSSDVSVNGLILREIYD